MKEKPLFNNRPISRRDFFKLAGALAVTSCFPQDTEKNVPVFDTLDYAYQAEKALEDTFYHNTHFLEKKDTTGKSHHAYNWTLSHVFSATLDLHEVSDRKHFTSSLSPVLAELDEYWVDDEKPSYRALASVEDNEFTSDERFHDDNAWIGLNLMRTYTQTGDSQYLEKAKIIFNTAQSGYDTDKQCNTEGIFWMHQNESANNQDKNTVSNAPNAQLGLRIYQETGDQEILTHALKLYTWVNDEMKSPENGLFWDHIKPDCTIDKTQWTYNQGTMIGANTLLYEITRDKKYLTEAQTIAQRSLDHFDLTTLLSQEVEFHAIYFRNLLYLSSQSQNTQLYEKTIHSMKEYAQYIWEDTDIHRDNGLFYFKKGNTSELIDQAAVVQIFALLSLDKSKYSSLL